MRIENLHVLPECSNSMYGVNNTAYKTSMVLSYFIFIKHLLNANGFDRQKLVVTINESFHALTEQHIP
jgi:hypothetical protein